eukprot:CAMPEP_0194522824 /NCGR_PEP_ID=MMETSP0253-20130528/57540_1 /TAXON_ID=2966 /ORGANISM="Noctiluca scintillans" /LENGTH=76 /DNA_ID=CAMNT_0039367303 /DNA_START=40 /DNA_END=270 /DNA_ORIENTATION=-
MKGRDVELGTRIGRTHNARGPVGLRRETEFDDEELKKFIDDSSLGPWQCYAVQVALAVAAMCFLFYVLSETFHVGA